MILTVYSIVRANCMNYVTTKEYFLHFAYVVAILWELNVVAKAIEGLGTI